MLFGLMKMDKMISNGTMQDKILLNLNFQITKGYGTYHIHTYENKDGKMIGLNGTTFNLEKPNPTVETSFPTNWYHGNYCQKNVPDTMHRIVLPTWSEKNGQDDYNGTKQAKIRMVATALGWNSESITTTLGLTISTFTAKAMFNRNQLV